MVGHRPTLALMIYPPAIYRVDIYIYIYIPPTPGLIHIFHLPSSPNTVQLLIKLFDSNIKHVATPIKHFHQNQSLPVYFGHDIYNSMSKDINPLLPDLFFS